MGVNSPLSGAANTARLEDKVLEQFCAEHHNEENNLNGIYLECLKAETRPLSKDEFIVAAENGILNASFLKSLLLGQPDVNAKNEYGYSALILAAWHGHLDIVKVLLANNADVDLKDNDGNTALSRAALYEQDETVQALATEMVFKKINTIGFNAGDKDQKEAILDSVLKDIAFTDSEGWITRFPQYNTEEIRNTVWEQALNKPKTKEIAELFALQVFVSDNYLTLPKINARKQSASSPSEPDPIAAPTSRFFSITSQLPMELQMVLSHRAFGSNKTIVLKNNSEPAFKKIAMAAEADAKRKRLNFNWFNITF